MYFVEKNTRSSRGASKYVGVWKDKNKWRAQIYHGGSQIYIGKFDDDLEAARQVNRKCDELNIPPKNPCLVINVK